MFSMPPAMATPASPTRIIWSASITALIPEAQASLTATACTLCESPPKIAAWRAGLIPWPAAMQVPMITSSTRSGGTPVRSSNALMQVAPS